MPSQFSSGLTSLSADIFLWCFAHFISLTTFISLNLLFTSLFGRNRFFYNYLIFILWSACNIPNLLNLKLITLCLSLIIIICWRI